MDSVFLAATSFNQTFTDCKWQTFAGTFEFTPCEATRCEDPASCSSGGVCTATGTCACARGAFGELCEECVTGFTGTGCKECLPGFHGLTCQPCDQNTFSIGGVPQAGDACESCPNGTVAPVGAAECIPCEAGFARADDEDTCNRCDANHYALERWATCRPCEAGEFSASGAAECTPCEEGFARAEGEIACNRCDPNTYALKGWETCRPCGAGSFSASGAAECTPCLQTTYSATPGQDTCQPCVPFSTTIGDGSTGCYACLEGYYRVPFKVKIVDEEGEDVKSNVACSNETDLDPAFFAACCRPCNEISGTRNCDEGTTLESLPIKRNYWRATELDDSLYRCFYKKICEGWGPGSKRDSYGDGLCQDGHEGPLCNVCKRDWYFSPANLRCEECRSASPAVFGIVVAAATVLLIAAALGIFYPGTWFALFFGTVKEAAKPLRHHNIDEAVARAADHVEDPIGRRDVDGADEAAPRDADEAAAPRDSDATDEAAAETEDEGKDLTARFFLTKLKIVISCGPAFWRSFLPGDRGVGAIRPGHGVGAIRLRLGRGVGATRLRLGRGVGAPTPLRRCYQIVGVMMLLFPTIRWPAAYRRPPSEEPTPRLATAPAAGTKSSLRSSALRRWTSRASRRHLASCRGSTT